MICKNDQLYQTAAEKAYEAISEEIISGENEPGKRLVRRLLAQELGMSAIPILEAMKRLEHDGLIEFRAHWGSIVTIPTIERVMDMFTMREALEYQVARILAVKATGEQQEQLLSLTKELDKIRYEATDAESVTNLHIKFHLQMAEFTGFPSLLAGLQKNNFQWLILNATRARRLRANIQLYWHATLLEHIFQQDPDLVEKMREHIYTYTPILEDLQQIHRLTDSSSGGVVVYIIIDVSIITYIYFLYFVGRNHQCLDCFQHINKVLLTGKKQLISSISSSTFPSTIVRAGTQGGHAQKSTCCSP